MIRVTLTHHGWVKAGSERYGKDSDRWKLRCPCCGHVTTIGAWRVVGAVEHAGFACIGRWIGAKRKAGDVGKPGPCDYTGAGHFGPNPLIVHFEGDVLEVFDFADRPLAQSREMA